LRRRFEAKKHEHAADRDHHRDHDEGDDRPVALLAAGFRPSGFPLTSKFALVLLTAHGTSVVRVNAQVR
jgi:hypothetical protein